MKTTCSAQPGFRPLSPTEGLRHTLLSEIKVRWRYNNKLEDESEICCSEFRVLRTMLMKIQVFWYVKP